MKYVIILLLAMLSFCNALAQDGWIMRKSGTVEKLRSIASKDGQNVVAVGDSGMVVTSNTAGVTWQLEKRLVWTPVVGSTNLNGVTSISDKIFCAVSARDSIFRTTDGGHIWVGIRSRAKGDCTTLTDVFWMLRELRAISFDSTINLCIAVGDGGETIFSRDSGKKWYENLPNSHEHFTSVSAWDGHSLTSLTYGQAFSTSDLGDTWITEWLHKNTSLNGSDAQSWIVVGDTGSIYHSPNGGFSWDSIPSPTKFNLNATHFGNIVRGYAVGDHGTILMTTDGGYSWVQQHCPTTQNLRSIHMSDPFHGFICGDSGVILTTQNGGYADTVARSVDPSPESADGIRNYPNPFSLRTTIEISIPHQGHGRLSIYNMLGEEIAVLASGSFEPGLKTFEWNTGDAPSGAYLCKWDMDGRIVSSQITLEK